MYASLNAIARALFPTWIYEKLIGRWDNYGLKRYAHNTFWALAARILSTAVSFFVSIYLIRYLGPEHYGNLSYAISFVGLFAVIGSLGIDHILYRELVQHPQQRNAYLGSAFILKLGAGAAATLITTVVALFISTDDVSRLIIVLLACCFIFNAFNVIIFEFQANVAQKYISIVSLIVVVILNALKLCVIAFDQGILYIGIVLLLESILYAALFVYIRTRYYGSLRDWKFHRTVATKILRDSWPFIFVTIFMSVYARIDQVLLKHLIDSTAVGLYDAAVRIAEAWLFLPGIIASSLFPAIINARNTNYSEYKKRVLVLIGFMVTIAVGVATITSLFSYQIVVWLYGNAFAASGTVLAIYIWSGVFLSMNTVLQYYLLAEHRHKTIFFVTLSTMLLNVVLNLLLIPYFGIIGAAVAAVTSLTVLMLPAILIFTSKK